MTEALGVRETLVAGLQVRGSFNTDYAFFVNLDGEGYADILEIRRHSDTSKASFYVRYGDTEGEYSEPVLLLSDQFHGRIYNHTPRVVGDLNGDGYTDLVTFAENRGTIIYEADRNGSFERPSQIDNLFVRDQSAIGFLGGGKEWQTQQLHPRQLADINADGRDDIVAIGHVKNGAQGAWWWSSAPRASGPNPAQITTLAAQTDQSGWENQEETPRYFANIDGRLGDDFIGFRGSSVVTAISSPNGSFSEFRSHQMVQSNGEPVPNGRRDDYQNDVINLVGYVNGDQIADIVTVDIRSKSPSVYIGYGHGDGSFSEFQKVQVQGLNKHRDTDDWNWQRFVLHDVNGDGRDDLAGFGTDGTAWFAPALGAPPKAKNDHFSITEDQAPRGLFANLFSNNGDGPDFDVDGDKFEVVSATVTGVDWSDLANPIELKVGEWTRLFFEPGELPALPETVTYLGRIRIDKNGDLSFLGDGAFEFLNGGEGTGIEIDYEISDFKHGTDIGLASISVIGRADRPDLIFPETVSIAENSQIVGKLTFSDPDSDSARFIISGGILSGSPDGDLFEIVNGNSLRFKDAPDYEVPTDRNEDNIYDVVVGVIDDRNQVDFQRISVSVQDVEEGFTNYVGGEGDDRLVGDENDNRLHGLGGNDLILGNGGNDKAWAGAGDDRIHGGLGADQLNGEAGNDRLWGNSGNDLLKGGDGYDKLWGGDDKDRLYGGRNNDQLRGENGDDKIWGDQGADLLFGGSGNDKLWGGAANDRIYGNTGRDLINGGSGNDKLWGGSGIDYFEFRRGFDQDTIFDFEVGIDRINLRGANLEFGDLQIGDVAGSTHIHWQTSDLLILRDIEASSIGVDDFIF